jgi:hypothetical protein
MEQRAARQIPPDICVAVTCWFGVYKLMMVLASLGAQVHIWTNRQATALHGQRMLLGIASWCSVASRWPFFWLSMVMVTALAAMRWALVDRGESLSMTPSGHLRQNCCISLWRICVVRVCRVPGGVYSPTWSSKKNARTTRSAKAWSFGSWEVPSCFMTSAKTETGNASCRLGAGSSLR